MTSAFQRNLAISTTLFCHFKECSYCRIRSRSTWHEFWILFYTQWRSNYFL